jgi:hypothetical protein
MGKTDIEIGPAQTHEVQIKMADLEDQQVRGLVHLIDAFAEATGSTVVIVSVDPPKKRPMSEHEIAELADGDENRCGYTVHANGDWGDYRCELTIEHFGSHAIGLRHHAVPLVNSLEAELEAVRLIMDQPWDDSHDRGHEEAFKRLAKISNALNMNSDPVTKEVPSSD